MKTKIIALAALSLALNGCAVAAASKHRGVAIEEATRCATRTCFLTLRDATVVTSETHPDGSMIETYRILLAQGSTDRAVMHGVLDVATFGIWEVAGTPIEGSANKDQFTIITASYDTSGRLLTATLGDRTGPQAASEPTKASMKAQ